MDRVSEAVFGFLGVIVGAGLTGLADYLLEKRRDHQALKTARRMLRLELQEAETFLNGSLEAGRWAAEPARVLSNDQWAEHRGVWGSVVGDDRWEPVAEAFMAIAEVRRRNVGSEPGARLDPADSRTEHAAAALEPVRIAIKALADNTRP